MKQEINYTRKLPREARPASLTSERLVVKPKQLFVIYK